MCIRDRPSAQASRVTCPTTPDAAPTGRPLSGHTKHRRRRGEPWPSRSSHRSMHVDTRPPSATATPGGNPRGGEHANRFPQTLPRPRPRTPATHPGATHHRRTAGPSTQHTSWVRRSRRPSLTLGPESAFRWDERWDAVRPPRGVVRGRRVAGQRSLTACRGGCR